MTGSISVAIADGVAAVVIDNPAQRNALTVTMCVQLAELMPRLEADPNVVVLTLRGAGAVFCAGAALGELPSILMDPQPDGSVIDHLSAADDAITALSKPTMALVDGACMGGGWQIASACDFIVASERSSIGITPAKLGIIYPRSGIERLVRQVGPAAAKYILFTGHAFSAADAKALGLVAETIPDDAFDEHCAALVSSIRARSRFSTHHLKRLVDRTAVGDPDIDRMWDDAWDAMTRNPDMAIGVEAFANRTQPGFTWSPAPVAPIAGATSTSDV